MAAGRSKTASMDMVLRCGAGQVVLLLMMLNVEGTVAVKCEVSEKKDEA